MRGMYRIVGLVMAALMLGAFALPAAADKDKDKDKDKKQYSLVMSVPPGQQTAPFTVKAKIKNEGNSSIHSFQLFVTGVKVVGVNKLDDAKVAFNQSTITVTKADDLESGESRTLTIMVNSCGDGQWLASVWNGAQLNGQSFALVPAPVSNLTSSIPCGPPLAAGDPIIVPDSLNPNCGVTGNRGYYDKDGSIPVAVPIFVTNSVPGGGPLHFRWPDFQGDVKDPLATFEYTICASGPSPAPGITQDAWLNSDGSPASTPPVFPAVTAYVTAQDCLFPAILPMPYGTLVSDNGGTTIIVNALSPVGPQGSIHHPLPPFDAVIGTERVTVTGVGSDDGPGGDLSDSGDLGENEPEVETWTVIRAVGGTSQALHTGGLVMSTPLPLLPATAPAPYIGGNQALMCIAARSESEDHQSHTTTFIDIGGDGWGSHP